MKKTIFLFLISIVLTACVKARPQPAAVDTTPPQIDIKDSFIVIDDIADIAVTDDSGEDVAIEYSISESEYPLCHVLTLTAADAAGNSSEKTVNFLWRKEVENVYTTTTGHLCYKIDEVSYVDGYLIANKSFSLPANYGDGIVPRVQTALDKMTADAKNDGAEIWMRSGFRSYDYQNTLFTNYANRDGIKARETYSARPGYSEHQTGLAMDLNSLDQSFENTKEFKWLNENACKYGFILRYVKYKEDQTGYIYEPWHYRYVGTDLAQVLYNGGDWLTMEEYFGIDSHY